MRRIPDMFQSSSSADRARSVMGHSESKELVVEMNSEDPLLLIINHCREMKQQEARLRIVTLLLLLGCSALTVFTCLEFSYRKAPADSASESALAAQKAECPSGPSTAGPSTAGPSTAGPSTAGPSTAGPSTAGPSTAGPSTPSPLRIDLRLHFSEIPGPVLEWEPGETINNINDYNSDSRAIVIPAPGYYFVYFRFLLACEEKKEEEVMEFFHVKLLSSNKGYGEEEIPLMEVKESMSSSEDRRRTASVGQLFHLSEGDHLKVFVLKGLKLLVKGSFGAFQL
ncbi:PREDICTED: uncharacterized protein LOC107083950 [Cyprinodon variegatus]|uniref:uncharacterized protein LOC107083950 n=1 Tax=Cyprinodon variegatus TaxID=28743 RepID=UPI0007429EA7|nr:PREDICTED: uncharacterized protein LOC107083950 [Cyprinodon variegatus]